MCGSHFGPITMSVSFISFLTKKSATKGTYSQFSYTFFLLTPPCISQENKGPAGRTHPAGHIFNSRTHHTSLSMSFVWTGWNGEMNIKSFTPARLLLLYSFSAKFRVDTQHVPICLKNHPNLSVAAQVFARSTTEFLRLWARVCKQKEERYPFFQDEPSSGGWSMVCWRGSVHLNPQNTFLTCSKLKGINPVFLPCLTG